MLNFCEGHDHKIPDRFGIQLTAQKCKETWIKFPTSLSDCGFRRLPNYNEIPLVYRRSLHAEGIHMVQAYPTQKSYSTPS